jgi:hypothetical protein
MRPINLAMADASRNLEADGRNIPGRDGEDLTNAIAPGASIPEFHIRARKLESD